MCTCALQLVSILLLTVRHADIQTKMTQILSLAPVIRMGVTLTTMESAQASEKILISFTDPCKYFINYA